MANNFTIEGRALAAGFKDIQRTWMWELVIEIPSVVAGQAQDYNSERFLVHCRTAVVPGRSQGIVTSQFGGMVQHFMGKPTYEGTFAVNVEETEDMFVKKALEVWQEAIWTAGSKTLAGGTQGHSQASTKRDLTAKTCELQLFKYDGEETQKKFSFVNAVLQNVGQVAVGYADEASVTYPVTFQYDYYELIDK